MKILGGKCPLDVRGFLYGFGGAMVVILALPWTAPKAPADQLTEKAEAVSTCTCEGNSPDTGSH